MTDTTKTERYDRLRADLPAMLDHLAEFAKGGSSHEAWASACVTFVTAHIHSVRDMSEIMVEWERVERMAKFNKSVIAAHERDCRMEESRTDPIDLETEVDEVDAWLRDLRTTQNGRTAVWARKVLAAMRQQIDRLETDYYELDLQACADTERLKTIGRALA